ncbi:MAG: helix-turn-helix transcriptional regulator, partial [Clostridia bacterium]|nr:helix-turn-helix transcriptional regulator [Clostridia bacterium]
TEKEPCSKGRTLPNEEGIVRVSNLLKVLGEPSRMKIVLALLQGEMCVFHIVEAVKGTQSAVSHQLRILKDNNIVKCTRKGQTITYSIADGHVEEIVKTAWEHLNCKGEEE